jgi:hypothetical protein
MPLYEWRVIRPERIRHVRFPDANSLGPIQPNGVSGSTHREARNTQQAVIIHQKATVTSFYRDFLDRSAGQKPSLEIADIWPVVVAATCGVASAVEAVQKLFSTVLSAPAGVLPLVACAVLALWSIITITAKSRRGVPLIVIGPSTPGTAVQYAYIRPVRILAKVTFLLLVVVTPLAIRSTVLDLRALPDTLFGYLLDAHDGSPLAELRVSVMVGGADVTDGEWTTDSRGFFIVRTSREVHRNAMLRVFLPDCSQPILLPLTRQFEVSGPTSIDTNPRSPLPFFRYTLACKDKQ